MAKPNEPVVTSPPATPLSAGQQAPLFSGQITPWRYAFDNARDPYSARNALGITAFVMPGAPVSITPLAFADLPGTPSMGTLACVNDSNVNTWGSVIAGGGTDIVLAFFDGTNWVVH